MSPVRPRPERPEFVREFKEKFPQYMVRHRVRPGECPQPGDSTAASR
jgi:hypothetical protein